SPSDTSDATASPARSGSSGQPAAVAIAAGPSGPERRAATRRPRPCRNEPSNRDWPLLTPADPTTGSGTGNPAIAHAHDPAIGHRPHLGSRFVHSAAPRSKTAWPHAHA